MRLLAFLLASWSLSAAPSFTIGNVNVVDVETGSVRKSFVRVTNGVIAAIAPAGPKGTIDGSGKYLIPGLWDMHVHLWEKRPMLGMYVANGVLGVRDMGSDLARTQAWRRDVEGGRSIGPRIYTPGSAMNGPSRPSAKLPVATVTSADQARAMVDTLDRQGVDFIKTLSTLSRDAYFALAQRARVIRAIFAGHVPEAVTVSQALDARQKSMEHLFGIALACSSEEPELREARLIADQSNDAAALAKIRTRTYETFSESRATELFKRMARFDSWQTPTLTLRKRLALSDLDALVEQGSKLAPADVRATWTDPREDLKKATPQQLERFSFDYEFHARIVAMMQRSGVGLLAGTDTGDDYVVPGYALHDELELLVKAGLSPVQALRTATINPARYFGIETQAGSVARGKRADLVMLDANPLDDIRNTRRISAVVVRGNVLDRKRLDRLMKESDSAWDANSPSSEVTPAPSSVRRPASSRKRGSRTH
ncbi:MAG TPA: amidohydrolase family protein [Bryobacteraceae bacterium]|nr:amidohydrolase family protein [Bryobacteraceae bacterium]